MCDPHSTRHTTHPSSEVYSTSYIVVLTKSPRSKPEIVSADNLKENRYLPSNPVGQTSECKPPDYCGATDSTVHQTHQASSSLSLSACLLLRGFNRCHLTGLFRVRSDARWITHQLGRPLCRIWCAQRQSPDRTACIPSGSHISTRSTRLYD